MLTTYLFIRDFSDSDAKQNAFAGLVAAWLWFTVLFANFAEAMAEGRGKAQAAALRKTRADTIATIKMPDGTTTQKASSALQVGDLCIVVAGEIIPGDGEIVEGIATVDESAITGESAPVIRESGGDRSAVTGGTRVLSDEIVVRITAKPGETFLDRMIALVEGANRQKTPNEIALSILLAGLTIIFLLAVTTLQPFAIYSGAEQSIIVLIALLGVPHPHHDRRPAVGDRHRRHGPARAAQRAGDVGPRRRGSRRLHDVAARQDRHDHLRVAAGVGVHPGHGSHGADLAEGALVSSLADETPEGRSIVELGRPRLRSDDHRGPQRGARAVHRPDPHVGHGHERWPPGSQGCGGLRSSLRRGGGRLVPPRGAAGRRAGVEGRRDPPRRHRPLVGGSTVAGPRCDPVEGHREARHARALRPDAGDGHPHHHDHRRQPPDRGGDRRRGRRRRLPRRGDAPKTRWR